MVLALFLATSAWGATPAEDAQQLLEVTGFEVSFRQNAGGRADGWIDAVRSELVARHEGEHATSVIAWYQEPLGRKIRASNESLATREGRLAFARFAGTLERKPPSKARVALVRRLDLAAGASGQTILLAKHLARRKDGSRLDADELESLSEELRRQALGLLLFKTRDLTLDELRAYVTFTESQPFQWYREASFRGLERAITTPPG